MTATLFTEGLDGDDCLCRYSTNVNTRAAMVASAIHGRRTRASARPALVTLLALLLLFEAIAFNATLLESPQALGQLCRTLETTRWIPAGRSGNIFPGLKDPRRGLPTPVTAACQNHQSLFDRE